jgi:hypothetical protein
MQVKKILFTKLGSETIPPPRKNLQTNPQHNTTQHNKHNTTQNKTNQNKTKKKKQKTKIKKPILNKV